MAKLKLEAPPVDEVDVATRLAAADPDADLRLQLKSLVTRIVVLQDEADLWLDACAAQLARQFPGSPQVMIRKDLLKGEPVLVALKRLAREPEWQ